MSAMATSFTGPFSGVLTKADWVSCDGLGYYFPGGADVTAEIKDQTGNWSSLGVSSGSVSARFLTLALSHGSAPTGATYGYAIALADQDMAAFAASAPFKVLQNDGLTAAVRSAGATGVVFWAAGQIDLAAGVTLATDTPAVVWTEDDGSVISIAVADPAQGSGSLKLSLTGSFSSGVAGDNGITVDAATGRITADRAAGITHTVRLTRTASAADAGSPADAGPRHLDAGSPADAGFGSHDAGRQDAAPAPPDSGASNGGDASESQPDAGEVARVASGCGCNAGNSEVLALGSLLASAIGLHRARRRQ